VNNSWDLGNVGTYSGEFAPDIQSLTAAGIAVVCSAGNDGPPSFGQSNTSVSPANNPGAFSVGATDSRDQIASFSSRGPSAYDGVSIYPILVAPGVYIPTTSLNGGYSTFTNQGTSFAAPHVSGAIALLLSGRPAQLAGKPDLVENALTSAALDLGQAGPDNTYGYGRLDAANAVALLVLSPPAVPTGDVNGDGVVDIRDALLVLQTAVGIFPATPLMMQQGDVGPFYTAPQPDGVINLLDAVVVLKKVAGSLAF
jgi:subtilisin family serine protease